MKASVRRLKIVQLGFLFAAVVVPGCGGGGGGSTPAPAPATAGITLSGLVSTGGASVSAQSVSAKCAVGSGSTTTDASGNYSVTVSAASLPCLLEADTSLGKLHAVTPGTATTQTVEITPLTELVVANMAGGNTAMYYAGFDSTQAAAATPGKVAAALTAVTPVIGSAGINTGSLGDVLTGPIDATYTAALGTLNGALTGSGTTLATLSDATANGSVHSTASSSVPALPAEMLLKPKAATCSALRSGIYRFIEYLPSSTTGAADPVTTTGLSTIDAALSSPTVTSAGGDVTTLTPHPTEACRYTVADGSDMVVSQAGVLVGREPLTVSGVTTFHLFIGFPEQVHALAEFAGAWNLMEWNNDAGLSANPDGFALESGIVAVNAAGAYTSGACFGAQSTAPESSCATATTLLPVISANGAGGFDVSSTDPADVWKNRIFLYRAGNGLLLSAGTSAQGELLLGSNVRTLGLPTPGASTTHWNVDADVGNAVATLSARAVEIVSVDPATGTYARNTSAAGSTTTRPETLAVNNPRNGFTHRNAATVTNSVGATVSVREFYSLPLAGTGLSAVYVPANNVSGRSNALFELSVQQP